MDISQLFSDFLSIVTISMSLFMKVPQIQSIVKKKSAVGMNIISLSMELASYSTTACYNYTNQYAILSYMEYPILIAQEIVLVYVVLLYQGLLGKKATILSMLYFATVFCFIVGILPANFLTFMVPFCTPISLSSKGLQLWQILSTMNADSVSVSTWVISALTNFSRIYTILMDSGDGILLTNFSLSTIMSASIAVAAYLLQKKDKEA